MVWKWTGPADNQSTGPATWGGGSPRWFSWRCQCGGLQHTAHCGWCGKRWRQVQWKKAPAKYGKKWNNHWGTEKQQPQAKKDEPLAQLQGLLTKMCPILEHLDEEQGPALKAAVSALQDQLRSQEPKASKQARLQSVMAQVQAKRSKLKQQRDRIAALKEELGDAMEKADDLEEEVTRLVQEEKVLCAEVQEAEDQEPQEGPKYKQSEGGLEQEAEDQDEVKHMLHQLMAHLHKIAEPGGQPRKKPRSTPGEEDADMDASCRFPEGWGGTQT